MPDDETTIRFLADMGVSWRVVEWLRSQGYDAKHLPTRTSYVMERLSSILVDTADALRKGAVVAVEDSRHRVRRLPIGRSEGVE